MKKTISLYDFQDAFKSSDTYKNNFTYDWLDALFDYFEQYESETETEIDFDMVAICCDYSEYESATEAFRDITWPYMMGAIDELEWEDDDEKEENALSYLRDNTQVITFDTWIIIQNF